MLWYSCLISWFEKNWYTDLVVSVDLEQKIWICLRPNLSPQRICRPCMTMPILEGCKSLTYHDLWKNQLIIRVTVWILRCFEDGTRVAIPFPGSACCALPLAQVQKADGRCRRGGRRFRGAQAAPELLGDPRQAAGQPWDDTEHGENGNISNILWLYWTSLFSIYVQFIFDLYAT